MRVDFKDVDFKDFDFINKQPNKPRSSKMFKTAILKAPAAAAFALAIVSAIMAFNCASVAKTAPNGNPQDDIDLTIREVSDYLNGQIPGGNRVVILNMQSDYAALSDYIIDELIANAVNDKVFSVVDRAQLDQIRTELKFQLSEEVDDKQALEIGKIFGAQTIVSGAVSELGDRHRMRVRAMEVQTAQVIGQYNRNIASGPTLAALMKGGKTQAANYAKPASTGAGTGTEGVGVAGPGAGAAVPASKPTSTPAPTASPAYKVGDTGPAGGLIFYDKGNNVGGWRYMEAAPVEYEKRTIFWVDLSGKGEIDDPIVETGMIGDGLKSTQVLFDAFVAMGGGGFRTAVRYCVELEVNGYKDWFVPTLDELKWVQGNLYLKDIGDYKDDWYWSIKVWRTYNRTTPLNFKTNETDRFVAKDDKKMYYIRPVRRF